MIQHGAQCGRLPCDSDGSAAFSSSSQIYSPNPMLALVRTAAYGFFALCTLLTFILAAA